MCNFCTVSHELSDFHLCSWNQVLLSRAGQERVVHPVVHSSSWLLVGIAAACYWACCIVGGSGRWFLAQIHIVGRCHSIFSQPSSMLRRCLLPNHVRCCMKFRPLCKSAVSHKKTPSGTFTQTVLYNRCVKPAIVSRCFKPVLLCESAVSLADDTTPRPSLMNVGGYCCPRLLTVNKVLLRNCFVDFCPFLWEFTSSRR